MISSPTAPRSSSLRRVLPALAFVLLLSGTDPDPLEAAVNSWSARGPEGGPVWDLAIDPTNSSFLYAGLKGGIFQSTDAGASWRPYASGAETQSVRDLVVDPGTSSRLYAGTSGGGVFTRFDRDCRDEPANVVENCSLESGIAGWSGTATAAADGSVQAGSLELLPDGEATQCVEVQAGIPLDLQADVRVVDGSPENCTLLAIASDGADCTGSFLDLWIAACVGVQCPDSWRAISTSALTPPGTESISVRVQCGGSTPTARFDNVIVAFGIFGDGFESGNMSAWEGSAPAPR